MKHRSNAVTLTTQIMEPLTSNQRLHWAKVAFRKSEIRATGGLLAALHLREFWPPETPVRLTARIQWRDRRVRDANNLEPTIKALVDGIVDSGLLPDDNIHVIPSVTYTGDPNPDPKLPPRCIRITITITTDRTIHDHP